MNSKAKIVVLNDDLAWLKSRRFLAKKYGLGVQALADLLCKIENIKDELKELEEQGVV